MEWIAGLVGVALGSALTYEIQRRLRKEDNAVKARLVLIETLALLWDSHFQVIKSHLHRVRVYLEDAGVDEQLIEKHEELAWACWRDAAYDQNPHPDEGPGIESTLVAAYEEAVVEIHSALRPRWFR